MLFDAMAALVARGVVVEGNAVKAQLHDEGLFDRARSVGDFDLYLLRLLTECATAENVEYWAQRIRGKADRRRAAELGRSIAETALEAGEDGEVLAKVERLAYAALEARRGGKRASMADIMKAVYRRVEGRAERDEATAACDLMPTYPDLDLRILGLEPGTLYFVGARPSMGKTALAMGIASAAAQLGHPQLVFSLEMQREALGERMVAAEGRLSGMALRAGRLDGEAWKAFARAASRISGWPIEVDDRPALTVREIRSSARQWVSELRRRGVKQLPCVWIDYLQLIASPGGRREVDPNRELAETSASLKAMVKELALPVVALSQLNRDLEKRSDSRPILADLRGSGAIEQDADTVLFVYRDEKYDPGTRDAGIAEVIIGKQRNGPTATVRLGFDASQTRFYQLPAATPRALPAFGEEEER